LVSSVAARAGANIAFIKYWGNRPGSDNLPLNPSISMTLSACVATTAVTLLDESASGDEIRLDGAAANEKSAGRIGVFLDRLRRIAGRRESARVASQNSFPTGCGIASSASGFAALAVAAAAAYGIRADAAELSRIARLGSGSAARSVPGGFVELHAGSTHEESFAEPIAPETHWPELRDLVALVSRREKPVSSAEGHRIAHTSEALTGRLSAIPGRARRVREGILRRDLTLLGEAAEEDALSMHAVMLTSTPPLIYWTAGTLEVMRAVYGLRKRGIEAYFTIDAGPNVHVLALQKDAVRVADEIAREAGCEILTDHAGSGARIV
jgi:diphosphomevalonate decarboxylase